MAISLEALRVFWVEKSVSWESPGSGNWLAPHFPLTPQTWWVPTLSVSAQPRACVTAVTAVRGPWGCQCWTAGNPKALGGNAGIVKSQRFHTGACHVPFLFCCWVARVWLSLHRLLSSLLLLKTLPLSPSASEPWGPFGLANPASPKAHFLLPFLGAKSWAECDQDMLPGGLFFASASFLPCHQEGRGHTITPSLHQQLTHWGDYACGSILQMRNLRLRQVSIWQLTSWRLPSPQLAGGALQGPL